MALEEVDPLVAWNTTQRTCLMPVATYRRFKRAATPKMTATMMRKGRPYTGAATAMTVRSRRGTGALLSARARGNTNSAMVDNTGAPIAATAGAVVRQRLSSPMYGKISAAAMVVPRQARTLAALQQARALVVLQWTHAPAALRQARAMAALRQARALVVLQQARVIAALRLAHAMAVMQ